MKSHVDLVAAVVSGEAVSVIDLVACDPEALYRTAEGHGVLPLLADRLAGVEWAPEGVRSRLREAARRHVAADLLREVELRLVLSDFHRAGVRPLLIKGAHLAYAHYDRPDLRVRLDTDVLVSPATRGVAHDVLTASRYEPAIQVDGDLVSYQTPYALRRDGVLVHAIDLHWRVANPQTFGGILSYDELSAAGVPLHRLAPHARGLSDVHALLLACVHRIAHHGGSTMLLWLYDIHLLALRLTQANWRHFAELARWRRVASVCRDSLEQTASVFPSAALQRGLAAFGRPEVVTEPESTAGFLTPNRRPIDAIVSDLRSLPSWTDRLRLLRQHLFPPARYMRSAYEPSGAAPLPLLYARRVLRGARKWLARP